MRTAIIKFALLGVLILFTIFACKKEDGLTGKERNYYYQETFCADPWGHSDSASDEMLKERISAYLTNTLGVAFSNLHITRDGITESCFGCNCKTGRIFRIEADEAYQGILIEKGFQVK